MKLPLSLLPRSVVGDLKDRIRALVRAETDRLGFEKLEALRREVEALRRSVEEATTRSLQWEAVWRREGSWAPLPPPHLQTRVVGSYVPGFVESGYSICEDLEAVLSAAGRRLADFSTILDFGCGCGRVIRALKSVVPTGDLHGTDIDAEAIGWLAANYGRIGAFVVAPHLPPLPYPDGRFDLVLGLSVFTHLPEDMQFAWLKELARITKPGGQLVLTTHGETHYGKFPPELLEVMATKGFLYSDFGFNYGKSISLPDFYQTSFHSHAYIEREWGKIFEILDIQALRLQKHQDTVLLRRRP